MGLRVIVAENSQTFFVKPFEPRHLLDAVRRAIARSEDRAGATARRLA
jgi:FixJ family two-component response regulator